MRARARQMLALGLTALALACSRNTETKRDESPPAAAPSSKPMPSARVLYLPDGSASGISVLDLPATEGILVPQPRRRCPPEMVDVAGRFCIDRFETRLVNATTLEPLSPYYHPTKAQTRASYNRWQRQHATVGSRKARTIPPPAPPDWQLSGEFTLAASSSRGVVPSGYMNREVAENACRNAGKRLCTAEEWVTACRGEERQKYPYGAEYRQNACNVFRATHPAAVLHDNASIGHLDPRLNQVTERGSPLLMTTGATETCRSRWGDDGVYDMVGNLDEWVDDPEGTFLGGFYARNTREGCDARIEVHPSEYFDYSLGTRCCR